MEGIVKRFSGVTALDGVDFTIYPGDVHALVGENGAGKSTLVKIMTGAYRHDAGRIEVSGTQATFNSPADAHAHGVVAAHQEIPLLPNRSVAENIFIGREPTRWGLVDWRKMFQATEELCAELGVDVDVRAKVGSLRTAQQQMVAIARGMSLGAKVLVLDEPTSSLAEREIELLFSLVRMLAKKGTAIVYISHRFDELYTICNRVTVLRDGRRIFTGDLPSLDRLDLVCLMLGRTRESLEDQSNQPSTTIPSNAGTDAPLLYVDALRSGTRLHDISFDIHRGEVVGLAGLLGSGRSETARVLFGIDPIDSGTVSVKGETFTPKAPRDATTRGLAFLSEDRKADGVFPDLSVRENLTLAALPALTRMGIVDRARQRAIVDNYMSKFGIKASSAEQKMGELSGGNQQKVLIARWLCTHPALFILDEPTRGIDIGARTEIHTLIQSLAVGGMSILMISSDLQEIVDGCSRVVVLRDGRNVGTLTHGTVSQDAIIRAIAGDTTSHESHSADSFFDDPAHHATA